MKNYLIIPVILLSIFSCKNKKENPATQKSQQDTTQTKSMFDYDTVLYVNGHTFLVQTIDPDLEHSDTVLLSVKRDSLIIFTDYFDKGMCDIQFPDFNNDGYFDLWFHYMGLEVFYLSDTVRNTFQVVKGIEQFNEPVQLKSNPDYFFSYSPAGCADYNWISKLFTIRNFETIELGYIYACACFNDDEETHNIRIYKISGNNEEKKQLISTLPLEILSEYKDKWNFIENYWNKNYKEFNE